MEQLNGGLPLPERYRGGALALGNFDGFHLGHQAVLSHAKTRAMDGARPVVVVTFDPHPASVFQSTRPPSRLSTLRQRQHWAGAEGADALLVIPFDRGFAQVSPEAFVADWLMQRYGARVVVTGQDFTFGRGRSGSVVDLARIGARHGILAEWVSPICDEQGAVSSTRIRHAIADGDLAEAKRLLSRPYVVEGVVMAARAVRSGRHHVASIDLADYQRPRIGTYSVLAHLPNGGSIHGVAEFGLPSTPVGVLRLCLSATLYPLAGTTVEVELLSRLAATDPPARRSSITAIARRARTGSSQECLRL